MPNNHEIEPHGGSPLEDDKFFPALGFIRELNKRIDNNQPLDEKIYLKMSMDYQKENKVHFGPAYPLVVAGEMGYNRVVDKVAEPLIGLLESERDKAVDNGVKENLDVVISVVRMEKLKADIILKHDLSPHNI
jgi:hypothetical protein